MCGELLVRPEGTIQSADRNEDGLYDPNSKCYWILVAPVSTTVRIEFLSISLEESNDCLYDFIAVCTSEPRHVSPTMWYFDECQGSRSPDFGAEIRPHSQCQKVCFFPNSRQKNPNFTKKKKKKKFFFFFFFFFFASPPFISYNINTEHIVTY